MDHSTRLFSIISVAALALALNACGGSSSVPPPPPPPPPPPAIVVTAAANPTTIVAGGTAQVTATVTNDSANKGVTWTLTCGAPPCPGAVSPTSTASGVATTYTAPATPPSADTPITVVATSVADTTKTGSANITISGLTVVVAPSSATVTIGTTAQFSATVTNDPTNMGVSWSVSCPTAPCGTVSPATTASGAQTTYTAPANFPAGDLPVTLTATSVANAAVSSSADITVPGTNVTVDPGSATVLAGANAQFTATVTNDPQNAGVTWSVSCSSGPCGTVAPTSTASGAATTYTAPTTPPAEDLAVTVTATSVFNAAVSAGIAVTVPAVTVSVSPTSAYIPNNISLQYTAVVGNDLANGGVTWSLTQSGTACSPACGTVSPTSTASGTATTYTAPASVPAGGAVTLTAASVTDTSKTATSIITVSSGTVELVPALLKFGLRLVGSTSAAQTIVLTNTGNSALTMTSVAISGANASDFALSPANPCGASVAAGATCNIGVTFKPGSTGTRSGTLVITDSSTDSPQQVALSGTGFTIRCRAQIKQTLSSAPVRAQLSTIGSVTSPMPTGASAVGTREMRLVDNQREDPFLENGSKRELMVRFWYPANLRQGCTLAEYTPREVWSYFSQLMGLPLPAVTTNSCSNAELAEGAHPVVVFTHGYTGTFTDYTYLFEDLASRGYVVISVDHTYEATAVKFPDGRFLHSGFGSHFGNQLLEDTESMTFALSVRIQDLSFITDQLRSLNGNRTSPFAGHLDLAHMAIAGHSMGGLAAAWTAEHDLRFQAGVILDVHDGYVPPEAVGATRTPVLILASGRDQWSQNECRLWSHLQGPRFAVNFAGAEHLTTSDAVWIARGAVKTGTMGPDRTIAGIRNYVADFLDFALKGQSANPRLTQSTGEYPDAVVSSPTKDLCSKETEKP